MSGRLLKEQEGGICLWCRIAHIRIRSSGYLWEFRDESQGDTGIMHSGSNTPLPESQVICLGCTTKSAGFACDGWMDGVWSGSLLGFYCLPATGR